MATLGKKSNQQGQAPHPGPAIHKGHAAKPASNQHKNSFSAGSTSSYFIEVGPAFPRTGLSLLEDLFDWKNEARGLGILEDFLLEPNQAPAEHVSERGLHFIYVRESAPGISNRLYWPKHASGVTLGPGYDMRDRSAESIIRDMKQLGLDEETAQKVSLARGLTGKAANDFAVKNKNLVDLTPQQEMQLLRNLIPPYEEKVRKAIRVSLYENQFDALVCFTMNVGSLEAQIAEPLNAGDIPAATARMKTHVKSGGDVVQDLVIRRDDEVNLFLHGYEFGQFHKHI